MGRNASRHGKGCYTNCAKMHETRVAARIASGVLTLFHASIGTSKRLESGPLVAELRHTLAADRNSAPD